MCMNEAPHTLAGQLAQIKMIRAEERLRDEIGRMRGLPVERKGYESHDMDDVNTMLAFDQKMDRT